MSKGNPFRLKKVIEKAKRGEEVTLAFIGGSITQGAGAVPIHEECYAWKTYCAFRKRFGNGENVHFLKAGVGGTPSELGMIRFERDILRQQEQPDLIVIEFAVNDEGDETKGVCYESLVRKALGTPSELGMIRFERDILRQQEQPDLIVIEFAVNDEGDETKGVCYESLVRKALNLPWNPAVVLLFSVFADDWNLQERLSPVGYHYHLPFAYGEHPRCSISPVWNDTETRKGDI